ncbi:MAG TPA: type II secretion system F family protein [Egibacteraceae bacterium]|nr:type II secretion system F family protein [Egibacteraceae bacterium]
MPIPVLLAAAAVAGSLPLLWWAIAGTRDRARHAVAHNLAGGLVSTDLRQAALVRGAGERAVRPALASLAERSRRLTPAGWLAALERRLALAGRPAAWPLERVLVVKLLLGAAGVVFGILLFSTNVSLRWFVGGVAAALLAYFTPDLLLYSKGTERAQAIQLKLPDTLDQMSICVEAGLGFEAAMARAGRTGDGPLADELMRTLQEMQVGVKRTQALRNLADRTNVADLRHFVLAVIQAESYGVPTADVLRTQAAEQRVKRRQRAEEKAMKIPVKVIFPLIFCILPVLFIVILGPAVINISQTLFGAGGLGG